MFRQCLFAIRTDKFSQRCYLYSLSEGKQFSIYCHCLAIKFYYVHVCCNKLNKLHLQHRKRRGASNLVRLSEKYSLSHDFNRIVYNVHEPLTSFKKSIWGQQSKGENLYAKSCKTNIGFQFDFSRLYLCPCFSYHLFKFIIIFLSFSRFPHYCHLIY